MAKTLLTTPIIQPALRALALAVTKLCGWKIPVQSPQVQKAIIVGAPHTSNWDFVLMLAGILIWRLDIRWIAKHTLFEGPFGGLMYWLGGIPINRSESQNFVEQMVQRFNNSDELLVVIAPEGTRKPVEKWKSGFYHMAKGADIPLVLVYLDYQQKEIGIFSIEKASGDAETEIARYQEMYSHKPGKIVENYYGFKGKKP